MILTLSFDVLILSIFSYTYSRHYAAFLLFGLFLIIFLPSFPFSLFFFVYFSIILITFYYWWFSLFSLLFIVVTSINLNTLICTFHYIIFFSILHISTVCHVWQYLSFSFFAHYQHLFSFSVFNFSSALFNWTTLRIRYRKGARPVLLLISCRPWRIRRRTQSCCPPQRLKEFNTSSTKLTFSSLTPVFIFCYYLSIIIIFFINLINFYFWRTGVDWLIFKRIIFCFFYLVSIAFYYFPESLKFPVQLKYNLKIV